jgi:1,4-dihydroxy-2-naphthoate polyprenyltransferase
MSRVEYAPSSIACWFQAMRPKTLTASLVPFSVGAALASANGAALNWGLLFCALISALFIQVGTNLINDAFDVARGIDNQDRLGPRRVLQNGMATGPQVYALGLLCFLAAFIIGIPLIMHGGPYIALILLLSVLSGYFYTGGPMPLAYVGLGDVFVVIFYGWVATMAGFWLQAGYLNVQSFLLGTQVGLLCTAIIAVNNLRDVNTDAKSGRKTLPVRFGQTFGKVEIILLATVPFLLNFFWFYWGYFFAAILPFLTLPLAFLLSVKVWRTYPSKAYNGYLALAALLHLSFGVLMIIGFMIK